MRREFARPLRLNIELRCQVAYVHAMQSAENTLRVVSYLPGAIETGNFRAHRFIERQQPMHFVLLAA